ncbi:MAG: hypothetical protein LBS70_05825 [Candidatus Accumulibacter sp.]|jgi:hypothetical protein|nr:hypothetical protein [Accumulibacter sp.]
MNNTAAIPDGAGVRRFAGRWLAALCLAALPLPALAAAAEADAASAPAVRVRMSFGGADAVVILFDNPASREFVAMLPMTLAFEDYAGEEKIATLPHRLASPGGAPSETPPGDFTYYAPWGNLAVFYKGFGRAAGLQILGRIESGKDRLAGMKGHFSARLEILEQ